MNEGPPALIDRARSICEAFLHEVKAQGAKKEPSDQSLRLINLALQVMKENTNMIVIHREDERRQAHAALSTSPHRAEEAYQFPMGDMAHARRLSLTRSVNTPPAPASLHDRPKVSTAPSGKTPEDRCSSSPPVGRPAVRPLAQTTGGHLRAHTTNPDRSPHAQQRPAQRERMDNDAKRPKRRAKSASGLVDRKYPMPAQHTYSCLPKGTDTDLSTQRQISVLTTTKGKTNILLAPNAREKPENQDRGIIVSLPGGFAVYGVFDGHGAEGHKCSELVMEAMMGEIRSYYVDGRTEEDILNLTDNSIILWMKSTFRTVNEKLRDSGIPCRNSGTTGTLAFYLLGRVIVGYVGDSTAVLYNWSVEADGVRMLETPEHSPAAPKERLRIQQHGGRVKEVWIPSMNKSIARIEQTGLSVSRAFGDFEGTQWGLSCTPEFVKFDLNGDLRSDKRMLLVVASDGLWDCVEPREVIKYIGNGSKLSRDTLQKQAEELCKSGWERRWDVDGRADDTTAVVALLLP